MENIISILITTLLSGLVATFATFWWQSYSEKKRDKIKIFTILMSKRYDKTEEECVEALNMIDVVFYKKEKVCQAWKDFDAATRVIPADGSLMDDKYLKLLEVMAESVGYRNIRWENIKQYYYPNGLSQKKNDEKTLRQVQIDLAKAQINSSNQSNVSN